MANSRPDLRKEAQAARLNSNLSQCFLVEEAYLQRIAEWAIPDESSTPVIEIGPGTGNLTQRLSEKGLNLTVIEVDDRFIVGLQSIPHTQVIHRSVLEVNLHELAAPKAVLLGNLPYHLTGPILFQVFGELHQEDFPLRHALEKVVIMVQKEVGDRLMAQPGDSDYSQLTLQLSCWADVEETFVVPRQAFEPSPKVDSMVLRIRPRSTPRVQPKSFRALSRLIKSAFLHRRKTLLNNLKLAGYDETASQDALSQLGLSPLQRPQEISLEDYAKLSDYFDAITSNPC